MNTLELLEVLSAHCLDVEEERKLVADKIDQYLMDELYAANERNVAYEEKLKDVALVATKLIELCLKNAKKLSPDELLETVSTIKQMEYLVGR